MKNIILISILIFSCTVFAQRGVEPATHTEFADATLEEDPKQSTDPNYLYSHSLFSADVLLGKWKRVGTGYGADLSIDENLYYYEKYFINTNCKIEEMMMKYSFMEDSIVMYEFGPAEGAKKVVLWIKDLTTDSLIVQDAETFEVERFVRADSTLPTVLMPVNELRYLRGVLDCVTDMSSMSSGSSPCIHINDLNLDLKIEDFEERFGNAAEYVESKEKANFAKYTFNLKPYLGTQPQLIVTYNDATQETQEIQIRGLGTVENLAFSSIRLGDYITYVEGKLGKPKAEIENINNGVEKWSYKPYPVIFEFKNRYVNGIKIYRK